MKKMLYFMAAGVAAMTIALLSSPALALEVKVEVFASGLQSPVDLKESPDGSGRIFIMQQTGAIVVITAAGTMHEQVNDHLKFLEHPQVAATGLIAWLDQPGIGKVPVPNVPGLQPLINGSPLAKSPTVGEHSAEILGALGDDLDAIAAFAARGVVNASAAA